MLWPRLFPIACLTAVSIAVVARPSLAQWQTDGAPVCQNSANQITPKIASDEHGGAIITWKDHRGFNYDIWAQRLNSAGVPQWTTDGVPVCTGNGEHDLPVIVSDGSGGAIMAWKDHRGSNYDIYAQRLDAAGVPQWTVDGVVVCNGNGEHDYPAIVSDQAGGAIITWTDYRSPQPDIYAQRVSALDGASVWTPNGVAICSATDNQFGPEIASDGASGAIITWNDYRSGYNADVYIQHVLSTGTVDAAWPVDGRGVCTNSSQQALPQIASDGTGGAIVTWEDGRNVDGTWDNYAHHILSSGGADGAWPADGLAVCTAATSQFYPQITSDGMGGAIIIWTDARNGYGGQVYAQHVLASGALDGAWPADGRALSTVISPSEFPQLISDGAGGAIVAWQDDRGTANYDIYAQHVLASGALDGAWPSSGLALSKATGDQIAPQLTTDGVGGAIVVWEDDRHGSSNADIFAMRIGGPLAAVTDGGPEPLRVRSPWPNPMRAVASIGFDLPIAARVSVKVYDVSGHLLRTLAAGQRFPAGDHGLTWDGRTDSGSSANPGIYFVRVLAGGATVSRSVTLLR